MKNSSNTPQLIVDQNRDVDSNMIIMDELKLNTQITISKVRQRSPSSALSL